MSDKGEPPPTRRKPPDRRLGVLDRPLMERDLFAPERSRVLPPYSQLPRRIGSSSATGTALGAGEAVSPPSVEPAPLPRRSQASRRRTPPEIDKDQLQEEKRLRAGSDSLSDSASPPSSVTPPERQAPQPVVRHNIPPNSPSPTTSPACTADMQDFGEEDPEGEREWDNTSYATLAPMQDSQPVNQEPMPGPSSAPDSYAQIAAAPRSAPPSPPPPSAQKQQQPVNNQAKYPPIIDLKSSLWDAITKVEDSQALSAALALLAGTARKATIPPPVLADYLESQNSFAALEIDMECSHSESDAASSVSASRKRPAKKSGTRSSESDSDDTGASLESYTTVSSKRAAKRAAKNRSPTAAAARAAPASPAASVAASVPAARAAALDSSAPTKPATRCAPQLAKKQAPPPVFLRDKAEFTRLSKICYDSKIKYEDATNLGVAIKILPTTIDDFRRITKLFTYERAVLLPKKTEKKA
ncbi:unnamed protein product [Parnassius mnemosyne]|uniref:Uncharacterized protein n=1 Tax=Parnassius mnemosyne TaxID=213953 RepID=A0AAV1LSZ3_9NEOP